MTCRSLEYPTMRYDHLDVSTRYNFSVFSYVNDTDKKKLLSTLPCYFFNYTGKYYQKVAENLRFEI